MMYRLLILFFLFYSSCIYSQKIKISLYNNYNIRSVVISPEEGKYELRCGNKVITTMKKHNVALIEIINDSIFIRTLTGALGTFAHIELIGVAKKNFFKIKPVDPDYNARVYDDNILLSVKNGNFMIINNVELENYISGVVQSEGGITSPVEYYKSQAVICRTYALQNLFRHKDEGFNLCDGVHCQAYFTKCLLSEDIVKATFDTKGLIIVDTTLSLITSAFHSNCGGQTLSSEDVWLQPRSYLKSIRDSFCSAGRNFRWTKSISVKEWRKYLNKYGIKTGGGVFDIDDYSFIQKNRMLSYTFNGKSIPFKSIRQDFGLRSSFFDIKHEGGKVIFSGKGYGHGVGLCQEGAMQMAKLGYSYQQIIKYYYKNIFIVSLRALEFFKEDE